MGVIRYFLDTSAYSAFRRGHPAIRRRIQESSEILFNAVVLGELQVGFLKGTRLEQNLAELAELLSSPRVSVLAIDEGTAERYAAIMRSLQQAGSQIPTNDIWIAASTMQYGATLLTTDRHFSRVAQIMVEIFPVE